MSLPFVGEIRMFSFDFAPKGWALCNGQTLAIQQNAALFSLLGTTYGGNGVTTFSLPNLQGRAPVHQGQGPGLDTFSLGEAIGEINHTLTVNEIPAHNHLIAASDTPPNTSTPGNTQRLAQMTAPGYAATPANASMNAKTLANAGGSQAHNNMQPHLVVNYSISLQGIFPSRT